MHQLLMSTNPIALSERLAPVTYSRETGVNLVYGEPVVFIPTPDSPTGFDLDGEYYGTFDAYYATRSRIREQVTIRVLRQNETLYLPIVNVFKLPDAARYIPGAD